jgi:putative ABC transport system ATP-binding protein
VQEGRKNAVQPVDHEGRGESRVADMEHASGGAIGDEVGEQAGEALHGLIVAQADVVEQGVVQADLWARSGEVMIGGQVLSRLGDRDLTVLRRAQVGFVFQFFNLLPMLTCEGNIVLPLKLAGTRWDPGWVDELIGKVGLSGRRGHLPSQLSGGQQQRVAIARALVSRPTVIFADEPTGNLDSHSGAQILELLRASAEAYHQTIVMVTHEPKVSTIADRILLLADGQIVDELSHPSTAAILRAIEGAS